MSSTIEVTTREDPVAAEVEINTSKADERQVQIDTMADTFEEDEGVLTHVETENIQIATTPKPTAADRQSPRRLDIPPSPPVKKTTTRPTKRKAAAPPSPAYNAQDDVFSVIDKNPKFARALKSTLPKPPKKAKDSDDDDDEEEEEEKEEIEENPRKRKRMTRDEEPAEEEEEDVEQEEEEEAADEEPASDTDSKTDDGSTAGAYVDHMDGSEYSSHGRAAAEEEAEAEEEPAVPDRETEYIEKMRVIEEIKALSALGIVPPQEPAFSMPLSLLSKIRDYMQSRVDEIMGVGMIGVGWTQVIGLIEKLNNRYDPFAKMFGMGLKLNGAKDAVESKIHLYENVFKHIYRKYIPKSEGSPWMQFVLVTVQILGEVHMENMKKEMLEEVEKLKRNPATREEAARLQKMANAPTIRKPMGVSKGQAPPDQPIMQPPSDTFTDDEEEGEQVETEVRVPTPAKKPLAAAPPPPPADIEEPKASVEAAAEAEVEPTTEESEADKIEIDLQQPNDEEVKLDIMTADDDADAEAESTKGDDDDDDDMDVVIQMNPKKSRSRSRK
jgi:hypothetical protein